MRKRGDYGWNAAGNCLWCGEGGRCQCDHSRLVEDTAKSLIAYPDLLESVKWFLSCTNEQGEFLPLAFDLAQEKALSGLAKAEGRRS